MTNTGAKVACVVWNICLLLRHLVLCVQADGPGSVSSPYHGNDNNLIH